MYTIIYLLSKWHIDINNQKNINIACEMLEILITISHIYVVRIIRKEVCNTSPYTMSSWCKNSKWNKNPWQPISFVYHESIYHKLD